MAELTLKVPQLTRWRLLIFGGGLTASCILAALSILYLSRATGLASIVGPISGFTPYFFRLGQPIPDGYVINKSHSLFTGQILQITLDKPNQSSFVLTEQTLPAGLSASTLLGGRQIKGAAGPASVNTVDEHVVGTLLPSGHSTLILITGPETANTGDVTDLLKALVVE